ncbi:hypothetical protein BDR26DRAFT_603158 [Obelidium mucronatum]|nr:hypothetical protein BDR26DRAFT_603158 [Obelidium mucronatum]
MFRELHKSEVTKEQLSEAMKEAVLKQLSQKHEDLIMNAISVYISHNLRVCLRDAVEKVLGSNQPNLRFNRLVLSRDNTTPEIDSFNREIKQFFQFHESYRSAVSSPTGRMLLNVRDSSINVELSSNTVISSVVSPIHRSFTFPRTFFRANKLARMLEPIIAARNYGYVQIIDRETIDLEDEDRIFKLLKAKYEEAMALSKTDTASLLVINLSDIVGMITKIQQSTSVSSKTENRKQKANVQETANSKTETRKIENVTNNSREQVILNSFESSYKQNLLDTEETVESYENKLEFSNDLVKNAMEKESTAEKEQTVEELTSRSSRNRATRVNEKESFLSKLMKKTRKETIETVAQSRMESTNDEHTEGRETDKTFRQEISDIQLQRKTAEISTTDTKSRSTDFRHDNVELTSRSETDFTASTKHERLVSSTNESLTERDTFRQDHLVEKSRTEQAMHEQVTAEEYEKTYEFDRFTHTNTISDVKSTEHADIEAQSKDSSYITEKQEEKSTVITDAKTTDKSNTKTIGLSTNDSTKTSIGGSKTTDNTTDSGSSHSSSSGTSNSASLDASGTIGGGLGGFNAYAGVTGTKESATTSGSQDISTNAINTHERYKRKRQ